MLGMSASGGDLVAIAVDEIDEIGDHRVELSLYDRKCFLDLDYAGSVEDVLRGGSPVDVLCVVFTHLDSQLPYKFDDRKSRTIGALTKLLEVHLQVQTSLRDLIGRCNRNQVQLRKYLCQRCLNGQHRLDIPFIRKCRGNSVMIELWAEDPGIRR